MPLVDPAILETADGLSVALCIVGAILGVLLWLGGGLMHRFWVVLGSTLIAGVVGLHWAKEFDMQPLVAGLLFAVAVGSLALALFRIVLFIVTGLTVAWIAGAIVPGWSEAVASFLAGGLLGIALYELCVIGMASFMGTLLISYSTLLLTARWGKVDVVGMAARQAPLLNWSVGTITVLGVLVQYLLQRRGQAGKSGKSGGEDEKKEKKKSESKPSFWGRVIGSGRKAG